jgi:hypothetical protein
MVQKAMQRLFVRKSFNWAQKENIRKPQFPDVFRRGENSCINHFGRPYTKTLKKFSALLKL